MAYQPVVISYQDLISGVDLSEQIAEAFGLNGLGLIQIIDIFDQK